MQIYTQPQPDRDSSLPATEAQPKDLLVVIGAEMPNAQCPITKEKPPLSKFIQTINSSGDSVILNLEAITHVEKAYKLTIFFQQDQAHVTLDGENADIFWEFLTAASLHIYQKNQEENKK